MGRRRSVATMAAFVTLVTVGATGCGADLVASTGVSAGEANQAPLEATATADEVPEAVCETERRTVATAAEAYRAAEGEYPTSVDELVGTFLDAPPEHHELRLVSTTELEVVPVAGGACA